jgi:hypothetical protein
MQGVAVNCHTGYALAFCRVERYPPIITAEIETSRRYTWR